MTGTIRFQDTSEIDFVVHGGGSMAGEFLHSLVATDVYSGWTEAVARFAVADAKKALAGACARLKLPNYSSRAFRRMQFSLELARSLQAFREDDGSRAFDRRCSMADAEEHTPHQWL